ncbi:MAG: excisionase family DNA-binding protein [Planctomycetaceae bacterium]|nr:excisionase family DNA-binding protein [Planctomycetaceae bacterium]
MRSNRPLTVTVERAAEYLEVSWYTIDGMIRRGEIPVIQMGRRRRIPLDAVDQLEQTGRASEDPQQADGTDR